MWRIFVMVNDCFFCLESHFCLPTIQNLLNWNVLSTTHCSWPLQTLSASTRLSFVGKSAAVKWLLSSSPGRKQNSSISFHGRSHLVRINVVCQFCLLCVYVESTSTRLSQSVTVDLRPANEFTRAYTPQNLFRHTVVAYAKFVSQFPFCIDHH